MADIETVTQAPSGYFSGFDWINTCMHCDGPARSTIEPGSYAFNGTIGVVSSDLFIRDYTAFEDQANNHSNGAISKLVHLEDFSTEEFREGVQFTQVEGKCTEPTLYPPAIEEDQIYFINELASTAQVIPNTTFSYGSQYFIDNPNYYVGYTRLYEYTLGRNIPSWITLNDDSIYIKSNDTNASGTYRFNLKAWMLEYGDWSISRAVDFNVHMVQIEPTFVQDMQIWEMWGDQTQTITAWSLEPSTVPDIDSYSLKYTIEDPNGAEVPDWITIDD